MKKFKVSFIRLFTLFIVISLLSACSSKSDMALLGKGDSPSSGFPPQVDMDAGNVEMDKENPDGNEFSEDNKVISNYYLNLETLQFEKSKAELETLIKTSKSYIENSNVGFRGYEYSRNYRYGDFSIRIPKENLESFKAELGNIGNITYESKDTQDVTKFYRDTESRLKLVTAKEERLLALLDKAVKIEDILAIESEYTDTMQEKEMLQKDLESIDGKIEYTSLNLQLTEVRSYSNTESADFSLLFRLKNAFKDSLFAFKIAIENFIVWLVYAIPYIVVLGIITFLAISLFKKRKKKNL